MINPIKKNEILRLSFEILSFFILILVLLPTMFFPEDASPFYYAAFFLSVLLFSTQKRISRFSFLFFSLFFLPLLPSLFTDYFDFNFFLNMIAFSIIAIVLSNFIGQFSQKLYTLKKFFTFLIFILFATFFITFFFTDSLYYLRAFDHNSFFLRMSNLTGLGKQLVSQLLVGPLLVVFFMIRTKNQSFLMSLVFILLIYLLLGSRSIIFGMMVFFILKILSPPIRNIASIFVFVFHFLFIHYLFRTRDLELFFQLDPRWGMQVMSIVTSENFFFGIGFGGWDDYVLKNSNVLSRYLDYFPVWGGYFNLGLVPTTLESTWFQLNAEIGFLCTTIFFLGFLFTVLKWIDDDRIEVKILASWNVVILFAAFYEDNFFQPFWWILVSLFVGTLIKKI